MKKNLIKAVLFLIIGILIFYNLSHIVNFLLQGRESLGDGQDAGPFFLTLMLELGLPVLLLGTSLTFIGSGLVQLRKYFKHRKLNLEIK